MFYNKQQLAVFKSNKFVFLFKFKDIEKNKTASNFTNTYVSPVVKVHKKYFLQYINCCRFWILLYIEIYGINLWFK